MPAADAPTNGGDPQPASRRRSRWAWFAAPLPAIIVLSLLLLILVPYEQYLTTAPLFVRPPNQDASEYCGTLRVPEPTLTELCRAEVNATRNRVAATGRESTGVVLAVATLIVINLAVICARRGQRAAPYINYGMFLIAVVVLLGLGLPALGDPLALDHPPATAPKSPSP